MKILINSKRKISEVNNMIYGQFIEHFHRQIYGGVYDPNSKFADEDGFRTDVIDAMKQIKVPILRWPGGCFVSAYHWKNGVGPDRKPMFDKAWRVEEPNSFGTDEYVKLCRKIGCEPYICTNAGSGTMEEMSDWVEYCNLNEGYYGRLRSEYGNKEPHSVKYWSIGNENWGPWEIGSNNPKGWGHLVTESAKMMKRTDPSIELSAAALTDMDWNMELLKKCGERLSWISIHGYWDFHQGKNKLASYEECLEFMKDLDKPVQQVKGLLTALGHDHIKIAYDEWNLRAWYHPNIMDLYQGASPEEYLYPRNDNDLNEQYTMADAVFTACFLNMCIRNSDVIGMANFSPIVNTRGMIFTYEDGIVLRSTYHVFDVYVNHMEENFIDMWSDDSEDEMLDIVATANDESTVISISAINKSPAEEKLLELSLDKIPSGGKIYTVNGDSVDSYNSMGNTQVQVTEKELAIDSNSNVVKLSLAPHSVNIIRIDF